MRRQVALWGRITDQQDNPVGDADVFLTHYPTSFGRQVKLCKESRRRARQQLPSATRSRPDGIYFYVDLPAGEYTVVAKHPSTGTSRSGKATVKWEANGDVRRTALNLKLSDRNK
jgi:hypothetical protein